MDIRDSENEIVGLIDGAATTLALAMKRARVAGRTDIKQRIDRAYFQLMQIAGDIRDEHIETED